jgi:hypothetical protein
MDLGQTYSSFETYLIYGSHNIGYVSLICYIMDYIKISWKIFKPVIKYKIEINIR